MSDMKILVPAAALLTLSACVFAVDGGPSNLNGPKRLEANAEAAVDACGPGEVALVTEDGFACKGAPESAIDALRSAEAE